MSRETFFRRMKKSKMFLIGGIGLIALVILCLLSPVICRYDPLVTNLYATFQPPTWFPAEGEEFHLLGTDAIGRDLFARLLYGGRASLIIAISVVIPSAALGIIVGLIAGYFSSVTDRIIMLLCNILMSIPALLLAICIVAVLGPSFFNLILCLTLTSWITTTRVVRATVLAIRNAEFVQAARVMDAGNFRIMMREILPNVVTPAIITESQHFGAVILAEASMSFLGLGIPLPTPSWGTMISDGRAYIATAPWIVIAPGIALMLAVLVCNFLGDGLRDILDPKNKD